jgi:hypothetical protein
MWTLKAAKEATELMKIISFIMKLPELLGLLFPVKGASVAAPRYAFLGTWLIRIFLER